MQTINLTPHEIVVVKPDTPSTISPDELDKWVVKRYPPSGMVARVKPVQEYVGNLDGVPVYRTRYGDTEGLPAPSPNTMYIVSIIVLQANPDREDLVAPDTGPGSAVRDPDGRILGVRRFLII